MADDKKDSSTVDALKVFDFQYLIAWVLPGLVATRAVAYYFSQLATAYEKASAGGDGAVVPLILLILAALTCGLTVSLLRQQFFDSFVGWCRSFGKDGEDLPGWRPNYAVILASKEKTEAFEKILQQVYRYYQFVANMAFSVGVLALARWHSLKGASSTDLNITRGLGALSLLLLLTAISQFIGWCRVHNQVCASPSRKELARSKTAAKAPSLTAAASEAGPGPATTATGASASAGTSAAASSVGPVPPR